jgi:cardiolipin synthase
MPNTLPNLFTIARIVLILPFAILFLNGSPATRWGALALFLVAAATDWVDGYLARRLNQGSDFGRMLDPIADKLLVAAVIVLLIATGGIAGWTVVAALLILMREIAVSGFREHLAPMGIVVRVSQLAKWKTACQLVALSMLIAPVEAIQPVGVAMLWLSAAITLVTGWGYFRATMSSLG